LAIADSRIGDCRLATDGLSIVDWAVVLCITALSFSRGILVLAWPPWRVARRWVASALSTNSVQTNFRPRADRRASAAAGDPAERRDDPIEPR